MNVTQPVVKAESSEPLIHPEQQKSEQNELLVSLEQSFSIKGLPVKYACSLKQDTLNIIKTLPKNQQELFANMSIICAEAQVGTFKHTDFIGFNIAMEELTATENKHIYITSFIAKKDLYKVSGRPEAQFLLNHPRVHFIRLPFSAQQFVDAVLWNQRQEKEINEAEKTEAFANMIEKEVQKLFHDEKDLASEVGRDLSILFHLPQKGEAILYFEEKLLDLLFLFRPRYKWSSREENLDRIISFYELAKAQTVCEGVRFAGVFVDFDNCLVDYDTKEINSKVLELIKQFQNEGKEITIRTLGDLPKKQEILDKAGIPFTVKSKADFKGATVEITVDDRGEHDLYDNIKIKTERHIQV